MPVGRLMDAPVPLTSEPTRLLSALSRSWYFEPATEDATVIFLPDPVQIELVPPTARVTSGDAVTVQLFTMAEEDVQPDPVAVR